MQSKGRGDSRRALFLALERFAGAPALLLDGDGRCEGANARACELLGMAGEAQLASAWDGFAASFGLPLGAGAAAGGLHRSASLPLQGRILRVGLELHELDAGSGGGHFALLKDCSALDALERELLLASECRSWAYQSAILLHDLRGILNSMQISLELLTDTGADAGAQSAEDPRRQRRVESLKEDLARMNHALQGLPGIGSRGESPVAEFDARDLVREILAMLRLTIRRNNVELRLDLPETPLPVRARRAWMRQALLNVMLYGLNAMRAGGSLAVSARRSGDAVLLRVDSGAAASEGYESGTERAFRAGRTGATDLVVARALCEAGGGDMQVHVERGRPGAVVEMTFPG